MKEKEVVLIVLWTTGRCNLKCKYCYAAPAVGEGDMDFLTAARALDYFAAYPMKIQFAGGEPLLNYELICRIYEYVREKGYQARFQMQTNGTLLDREKAKKLKEMKIALGVSLDGPPDVNEMLRGGTKQTVHGLQCLASEGITVNLNSVVTAQNVMRLPELVDMALYLGNVAGIGLDLLRDAGRAKESSFALSRPSPRELKEALNALHQRSEFLYRHSGKRIIVREIAEAKKRLSSSVCSENYCYASCGRSYVVLPRGDVYPCGSLIDNPDYYMGNIHQGDLKSIALPKIRAGECRDCAYVSYCPGGCPSRMLVNANESPAESLDCVLRKAAFAIAQTRDGSSV